MGLALPLVGKNFNGILFKKSEMAATAADSSYQSPLGEEAVVPVKTPLGKMPYILTNFHKTIFILNLVCPDWIKYCPTILNLNLNFHKTLVVMINQNVMLVLYHKNIIINSSSKYLTI